MSHLTLVYSATPAALLARAAAPAARPARRETAEEGFSSKDLIALTCWTQRSDAHGYRYQALDPISGEAWPALPDAFSTLATQAAAEAGFADFKPDACLINTYAPGTKMGLHQDRDEHDFAQPIVSVSLGLPAVFLFGGPKRTDKPRRLRLIDGDVVVWGGHARLAFHGVAPLADGLHGVWGQRRVNLTFRCAA